MRRICLIGNNAFGKPVFDGQRIKVRTYLNVLKKEGFDVDLIDLDKPFFRLFKIFRAIKKGLIKDDTIILISSDRGERLLVPYINRLNKKYKKRFIFSQIGTSFLYRHIKNLTNAQQIEFFNGNNFFGQRPEKKVQKQLRRINVILPETKLIEECFSKFYGLTNCIAITNFRDVVVDFVEKQPSDFVRLVYISRLTKRKGIFDLIDVVNLVNGLKNNRVLLDIYGTKYFDKSENTTFENLLSERIKYKGEIKPENVIATLREYDLLCFPTLCEGEGTPGCVIESLISGTPVLSSSFTQSQELLKNGFDSYIYQFGDTNDLKNKLIEYIDNKEKMKMNKNAYESGKVFTYQFNRTLFLKIICGD